MDEFDKLILGKAGIHTDIVTERGGKLGVDTNIEVPRPGESGKNTDINTTRPGDDGKTRSIIVERGGDRGIHQEINTSRGGDKGSHNEIITSRTGVSGNPHEIRIDRQGSDGKGSDITTNRSGTSGRTYNIKYDPHQYKHSYLNIRVPRPGNNGTTIDVEVSRYGVDGQKSDITTHRTGTSGNSQKGSNKYDSNRVGVLGEDKNIKITRYGNEGTTTQINASRSGTPGSETEIISQRDGDQGTVSNIKVSRHGVKGSHSKITTSRTGSDGVLYDLKVFRQGAPGKESNITTSRCGTDGTHENITVKRGGNSGVNGENTYVPVPDDTNPTGLNIANPKVRGLIGKTFDQLIHNDSDINRIARSISLMASNAGFGLDLNNYTQAAFWIKKLASATVGKLLGPQANGLEAIMGFTPTNDDIISYYKHLMANESDNMKRIPIDLAMRLLTIPSSLYLSKLPRMLFTGEAIADPAGGTLGKGANKLISGLAGILGGTRKLQYKAFEARMLAESKLQNSIRHGDAIWRGLDKEDFNTQNIKDIDAWHQSHLTDDPNAGSGVVNRSNFLGYKISAHDLSTVVTAVEDMIAYQDSDKDHRMMNSKHQLGGEDPIFYSGIRQLWSTAGDGTYEMADNGLWGVRVRPFSTNNIKCCLPVFPKEFSSGWWPVIACSYTKNHLQGKEFKLPFFSFSMPLSGERPSGMKLHLLDNEKRSMQYWLEQYVRQTFNLNNNTVYPYKNLLLRITVYRYDTVFSTLYSGDYLCLISDHHLYFNGEGSHGNSEIELSLNIVGEYPANEIHYPTESYVGQ